MITSKSLLFIYNKPMFHYPFSTLTIVGIKDILIVLMSNDKSRIKVLFSDGSQRGLSFQYQVRPSLDGVIQAVILGEKSIGKDACEVVLKDNIFHVFSKTLRVRADEVYKDNAIVFGYYVNNPQRFGIVEFDENGNMISKEEKTEKIKSNHDINGL